MLLELAIGDAYGIGFDAASPEVVHRYNDLKRYYANPERTGRPGCYSEKTQASVALSEALLDSRPWSSELFAQCWLRVYKRDPREGYHPGLQSLLKRARDPLQFLRQARSPSDRVDGAVRALPIGMLKETSQVLRCSEIQASITHNTPDGIRAARAASLMSHYFAYSLGPKEDLGRYLESHVEGAWSSPWRGHVGPKGWMGVQAAVSVLSKYERLSDLLHASIAFGGITSGVAALALGAAACSATVAQDLPPALVEGLENARFGRDYLVELDSRLKKLIGARRSIAADSSPG